MPDAEQAPGLPDGQLPRQYARPAPEVVPAPHIVAFLDVLGFKNLLRDRKFSLIGVLFEEIADVIYKLQSRAYLHGLTSISPKIQNFSDSVILYSPLHHGDDMWTVNQMIIDEFSRMCSAIIAVGLRLGIPIRGAVSIGDFYAGTALSVTPESTFRFGSPVVSGLLPEALRMRVTKEEYESHIIPAFNLGVHFGDALTEAYLLESSINAIGVFMDGKYAANDTIQVMGRLGAWTPFSIDGRELLVGNWYRQAESFFGSDDAVELLRQVTRHAKSLTGRVREKWDALVRTTVI
ncbi:MAG TPA: hypothetical protein VEA69_14970 [Tepidisphaeraceae bacterium]|nr:hypothetical protein [Tepidisphaeraceae bacterium]